jgi:nitroimidazol reductase NimA-like FMN-containing flavoprotein (pyridoxamine 5'-phosphate oxidase superfamily)
MVAVMDADTPQQGKLGYDDCWELLAAGVVGRLALIVDDHPEIFPVNYVLERRSIVFRTAVGTKLWGANASRRAAFEIDGYDARDEEAWSVVARGDTEVITDAEEIAAVDALQLEPWQPGAKNHYVRLSPRALTGRRFKVNRPDVWNTRLTDERRSSFE